MRRPSLDILDFASIAAAGPEGAAIRDSDNSQSRGGDRQLTTPNIIGTLPDPGAHTWPPWTSWPCSPWRYADASFYRPALAAFGHVGHLSIQGRKRCFYQTTSATPSYDNMEGGIISPALPRPPHPQSTIHDAPLPVSEPPTQAGRVR
jgi:hypothetical protein